MQATNRLAHFKNGGNSIIGLPVPVDDSGAEYVKYGGTWVHVSEVPLPRLQTVERIGEPILVTSEGHTGETPKVFPD